MGSWRRGSSSTGRAVHSGPAYRLVLPSEASPPVPLSLTGEGGRRRRVVLKRRPPIGKTGIKTSPLARQGEGTGGEASKGRRHRSTAAPWTRLPTSVDLLHIDRLAAATGADAEEADHSRVVAVAEVPQVADKVVVLAAVAADDGAPAAVVEPADDRNQVAVVAVVAVVVRILAIGVAVAVVVVAVVVAAVDVIHAGHPERRAADRAVLDAA